MRTAETELHPETGATVPESIVRRAWPVHRGIPYREPDGVSSDYTARAEVNHGRWVVPCPFCPGAQLASEDDHRFFCVDCLHAGRAEGRWLRVVWPRHRDAIEEVLAVRPEVNRNWVPGETVEDLRAEQRREEKRVADWLATMRERARAELGNLPKAELL